jgi:hypothetical protein
MRSILASTFAVLLSASVVLPAMAQGGGIQGGIATPAAPAAAAAATPAKPAEPAKAAEAVKPGAPARAGAVVHKDKAATPVAATPAAPAKPAAPKTN